MRSIVMVDCLFIMQSTLSVNSVDSDGGELCSRPQPALPPFPMGFLTPGWGGGRGGGGAEGVGTRPCLRAVLRSHPNPSQALAPQSGIFREAEKGN